jgi:hypothetical protein
LYRSYFKSNGVNFEPQVTYDVLLTVHTKYKSDKILLCYQMVAKRNVVIEEPVINIDKNLFGDRV